LYCNNNNTISKISLLASKLVLPQQQQQQQQQQQPPPPPPPPPPLQKQNNERTASKYTYAGTGSIENDGVLTKRGDINEVSRSKRSAFSLLQRASWRDFLLTGRLCCKDDAEEEEEEEVGALPEPLPTVLADIK
jgi:hypothetical protein